MDGMEIYVSTPLLRALLCGANNSLYNVLQVYKILKIRQFCRAKLLEIRIFGKESELHLLSLHCFLLVARSDKPEDFPSDQSLHPLYF